MARSINRVVLWYGLLALVAAAGGCQRGQTWNLSPVEGTVTKDGCPLQGVEVVFLADPDAGTVGPRARGTTDESGHYRLRIDNGEEGAVAGKYHIVVFDLDADLQLPRPLGGPQPKEATWLPPESSLKAAQGTLRIPPRYERFQETPLRAEVQPGPQVINLEVK